MKIDEQIAHMDQDSIAKLADRLVVINKSAARDLHTYLGYSIMDDDLMYAEEELALAEMREYAAERG